ncbi:hypothetical protein RJ640_014231 [Escallonia rubra]|uniref:Uncharacterized protein n=1 Tax=Escallonia rubra TaxID=112253 RepID=A0AA88RFH8_9ASTE|nr:hypothetical protein RJ640_014231 [Escallonia rubra]
MKAFPKGCVYEVGEDCGSHAREIEGGVYKESVGAEEEEQRHHRRRNGLTNTTKKNPTLDWTDTKTLRFN